MNSFVKCLSLSFIIVSIVTIMVLTVFLALANPILWILFDVEAIFVLAFFLWIFNLIW